MFIGLNMQQDNGETKPIGAFLTNRFKQALIHRVYQPNACASFLLSEKYNNHNDDNVYVATIIVRLTCYALEIMP